METLEKIFRDRITRREDGTYILDFERSSFRVYGVYEDYLIARRIIYFDERIDYSSGLCLLSIEDSVKNSNHATTINLHKRSERLWAKFGHTFTIRDYGIFYEVILNRRKRYYCSSFDCSLTSLMKEIPEVPYKTGLLYDNVRVIVNRFDEKTGKVYATCINTETSARVRLKVSVNVLEHMRPIDLIKSHKSLYPYRKSSTYSYNVTVNDITSDDTVIFTVFGDGKSSIECMPYDLFKEYRAFKSYLYLHKNSYAGVRDDTGFDYVANAFMDDIYYAVQDAGICIDKERLRGYF